MHEYSIVQALLERVEHEARARAARSVQRLHLRIGELAGVEVELLCTAYEGLREASICAGAELAVERVTAQWCCSRCEKELPRNAVLRCTTCDAPGRLAAGDEIFLDRIEMEVA